MLWGPLMEPYVSHAPWRRECWKGHEGTEGVRRTIKYARSHSLSLRLFGASRELSSSRVSYVEIPTTEWDALFFPAT